VGIAALINQHIKDREYDRLNGPGKVVEGSEYKVCSRKWRVSECCEEGISDLITNKFHYHFYSDFIKDKKRFLTSKFFRLVIPLR
jgi:hypothetical protein